MSQIGSEYINYMPAQKLLQSQGFGARSVAVQNKFMRKWAVWLLLVTLLALFYVWSRVQVVQLGYELTLLKRQNAEIAKQVSILELETAKLKSPKRLEDIATGQLGMHAPYADEVILVKPDAVQVEN